VQPDFLHVSASSQENISTSEECSKWQFGGNDKKCHYSYRSLLYLTNSMDKNPVLDGKSHPLLNKFPTFHGHRSLPLVPTLGQTNLVHILTLLPGPFALILAERCEVNLGVKNSNQTKKIHNISHRSNISASSDVSYSPNPNPAARSSLGT